MTGDQTSDLSPDQPTAEITDQPTAEVRWTPAARPKGAHWPAVVLGLVCLAIAGLALGQELGAFTVDWGHLGPLGIVLVGGVLVLVGLLGLLGRRRDGAREDTRYRTDQGLGS